MELFTVIIINALNLQECLFSEYAELNRKTCEVSRTNILAVQAACTVFFSTCHIHSYLGWTS